MYLFIYTYLVFFQAQNIKQESLDVFLDKLQLRIYQIGSTCEDINTGQSLNFLQIYFQGYQIQFFIQDKISYPYSMMMCKSSALNSKGFSSQVRSGNLPQEDHITYEGVFNELTFQVGPRAKNPLQLHNGFCRAGNVNSIVDTEPTEYVALFMKGSADGMPRDHRLLNSVLVLDISGSMDSKLTRKAQQDSKNRLDLSKEAILMFVEKLRPSDAFGLVVFDDKADVVIPCTRKEDIDVKAVEGILKSIKTRGGTTISKGFNEGISCLKKYIDTSIVKSGLCENRLVILTDVGDNSVATQKKFVQQVSNSNIHVTIVGISDDFVSSTCEQLNEIKGFNYFCATETQDIKKYLADNFDYTFFPSAEKVEILLRSEQVASFEVFGTADRHKVTKYNNFALKGNKEFVITRMESCFPSELETQGDNVLTHGGLILLKLQTRDKPISSFKGQLVARYRTPGGENGEVTYDLQYDFPPHEQFFSEKALEEAISGFFFVYEIKELIRRMKDGEHKIYEDNKQKYIQALRKLKLLAPSSKQEEVDKMIELVEKYKAKRPQPVPIPL